MTSIYQQVKGTLTENIVKRGVGTYMGEGSVLSEYLSTFSMEVSSLTQKILDANSNLNISSARGLALDRIGQDLQEPRLNAMQAQFRASDRVVRIETFNGNSFAQNGVESFSPGLRLFSTGSVEFVVTDILSFNSAANSVFVGARAVKFGSVGNIPKNSLERHSSILYRDVLRVNQIHSIYNGRDQEEDDSYISRLELSFLSRRIGSSMAVEAAIRRIPGIEKFSIVNQASGLGTLLAIVQPALGYYVYPSSINEIYRNLSTMMELGSRVEIRNPKLYQVTVKTIVKTDVLLNATQKTQLKIKIEKALLTSMNRMQIGQSLSLSTIADVIKSSDSRVSSFGSSEDYIDSVTVVHRDGDYEFNESYSGEMNNLILIPSDCLLIPSEITPFEIQIV
jgi:uncharacterized phage protein gp47/JayE